MSLSEKAKQLALIAHKGQTDKAGKPYWHHLRSVAELVDTEEEKTIAWLHDILEDTDCWAADLTREGFPDSVVKVVNILTKKPGEDYFDYIDIISKNKIATTVKIADLTNNLNLSRISNPTQKDFDRCEKYKKALNILKKRPQ